MVGHEGSGEFFVPFLVLGQNRGGIKARVKLEEAETIACNVGILGGQGNGAVEGGERLVELANVFQGQGEIVPGKGVIGVKCQDLLVGMDGGFGLVLLAVDVGQIIPGLGEILSQGDGLLEGGDGFIEHLAGFEGVAKVVVIVGIFGLERNGLAVGIDSLKVFSRGGELLGEMGLMLGLGEHGLSLEKKPRIRIRGWGIILRILKELFSGPGENLVGVVGIRKHRWIIRGKIVVGDRR